MRDLDSINSAVKSTKFLFTISLAIPLFMGCGAWALAAGAAPNQTLGENYLALLGLGITSVSIMALPIPHLFNWNWETKYFGAIIPCLSSASIVGIYPIFCIVQYSHLSIFLRVALLFFEFALIFQWCRRFINIYKYIYLEKNLFDCIYIEEENAIYYSQQADKIVIEKLLKFKQFPSSKYFISSSLIAFSLLPFTTTLSQFIGIPFIHIFLGIFSTPLNLIFIGLVTRGWLIFYLYPIKIKSKTNKPVYIDISSRPQKCLMQQNDKTKY